MNHLILLKNNWERFKAHLKLNRNQITELVAPYSSSPIASTQWLSDGCANTNYKITFKSNEAPLVLRIYTREQSALTREKDLAEVLKHTVPIPKFLFSSFDCSINHPYALIEWREGELMRDVILRGEPTSIYECAFEAGVYLNHLRTITLKQAGFFEENLKLRPFAPEENYEPFVVNLLQDEIVKASLGPLKGSVSEWIEKQLPYLPDAQDANLTHGDFDPANMLVKQINGIWRITAILDWEFAFSGPYLLDMGLFLRYAHRLPLEYQEGFLNGMQSEGFTLPSSWQVQAKLMDMLCLLQLLHYNPIESRPNLNRDVVTLINPPVSG